MADTLLFRGGSTADVNNAATTVNDREIVIDTETNEIVLGSSKDRTVMADGSTGNVTIGSPDFGSASFGILFGKTDAVSSSGVLVFNQSTDPNFNSCFAAYGVGANNRVAAIRNDGAAFFGGDVETTTAATGVILKSPGGTRYRLTVADNGTLTTTAV